MFYAINVNFIVGTHRRAELLDFTAGQQPGIVFISETYLNPRHYIKFNDFEFVRNGERNCNRGSGIGILVSHQYHFRSNNRLAFETFECMAWSLVFCWYYLEKGIYFYILMVESN